jgi:hypothetical protein
VYQALNEQFQVKHISPRCCCLKNIK